MLVLMVRGLFCKLNFPYAQFASSSMNGDLSFDPVWEAVSRLERLGFHVLGLTYDGAHNSTNEMIYKVPNIYSNNGLRYLYFFSDPPHLIKTIRNSWYSSKRHLWVRKLYLILCKKYYTLVRREEISWKHLEDLYQRDSGPNCVGLRMLPKLKYEHVQLVDLASQVSIK